MPGVPLRILLVWLALIGIAGSCSYGIYVEGPRQRAELDSLCARQGMTGRITSDGDRCVDERGDVFLPPFK